MLPTSLRLYVYRPLSALLKLVEISLEPLQSVGEVPVIDGHNYIGENDAPRLFNRVIPFIRRTERGDSKVDGGGPILQRPSFIFS